MANKEDGMKKYKAVFKKIFPNVAEEDYMEMKVGDPMEWDSLHQIQLISEIEHAFVIRLNGEDVPRLRSFQEGVALLRDRYGIAIA